MSATSTEVLGIIDWHRGGWYPEFWEYINIFWKMMIIGNIMPQLEELEAFDNIHRPELYCDTLSQFLWGQFLLF